MLLFTWDYSALGNVCVRFMVCLTSIIVIPFRQKLQYILFIIMMVHQNLIMVQLNVLPADTAEMILIQR